MNQIRRSVLAAIAAIAVIAAGGWFALISPQRHHAANLRSQTAAQELTNATTESKIRTLSAQQKNVPAEQARAAEIAQEFPATPALPKYVRDLADAAKATGVDLVSISPASPLAIAAPKAAAPAPAASAAAAAATPTATPAPVSATVPLQDITIDLQVVGSYFQIQQFVAHVEKLKRASLVTSLDLRPGKKVEANTQTTDASPQPGAPTPAGATQPPAWTTLNAAITVNVFMTAPGALTLPAAAGTAPAAAATPSPSASH